MQELSRLADMAEIIGTLIVIGGLVFALLQMRQLRQQRRELAAIELFRFFGNPHFAHAYNTVLRMPDGLSADEVRNDEELENAAMLISTTMENIGVMTYQRIVPFAVVNNLIAQRPQCADCVRVVPVAFRPAATIPDGHRAARL
jgi:hypothetical protein